VPAVPLKRRGPAALSGATRPILRVAATSRYLTYSEEFKPKADALAAAKGDAARFVHALHGDLDEGRVRFGIQHRKPSWENWAGWEELRPRPATDASKFAKELAYGNDVYVSLNARGGGIRALVADLDHYKVERRAGRSPEEIMAALMEFLKDDHLPLPNLVTFTGRGLQAIWTTTRGKPLAVAQAQRTLISLLGEFGVDPKVTDRSRMVRLPGTINSKSGELARLLLCEPIRYEFLPIACGLAHPSPLIRVAAGLLIRDGVKVDWHRHADEVPTLARIALEPTRGIGERPGRSRRARTKVEAVRQPISVRATVRPPEGPRRAKGSPRLVTRRIRELEALIKLRGGTVGEGLRNETVHIATVHLLQVRADVMAWAAQYAPGLTPDAIAATVKTALRKRYKYTSEKIGVKLGVSRQEVERLGLTSIKAATESREAYQERQRAQRAKTKRERRQEEGARPQADSVQKRKPWEAEGCSRRTWYRRLSGDM
jgi:hypothetical protein